MTSAFRASIGPANQSGQELSMAHPVHLSPAATLVFVVLTSLVIWLLLFQVFEIW